MSAIEPNVGPMLWFALLWTVCCLGFLVVSGMFPPATRPDGTKSVPETLIRGTPASARRSTSPRSGLGTWSPDRR
jgi:hypothetical protein